MSGQAGRTPGLPASTAKSTEPTIRVSRSFSLSIWRMRALSVLAVSSISA